MKYYHATDEKNVSSIKRSGIKINKFEYSVFLADNPKSAALFLAIRGIENIAVFTIELPSDVEEKLEESFDHSEVFFKCKAYTLSENIPTKYITDITHYSFKTN